MKKIYILFAISFYLFACEDDAFLEQRPSINDAVVISTLDDIDKLYNDLQFYFLRASAIQNATDNTEIIQSIVDEAPTAYDEDLDINDYMFSTTPYLNRPDFFWNEIYSTLVTANLSLEALNSGDLQPGDATLEAILRAESHFLRAFCFFNLATVYGLYPSTTNENEPGIVLRQSTSFEESLERATLKETFDFILNDIQEALKYPEVERKDVYRIGRPAVNALAARIYLYLGDYDNALDQAGKALQDFSTMVHYEDIEVLSGFTLRGVTSDWPSVARDLSRRDVSVPNFYNDQYYYVNFQDIRFNPSPSQELMDLYDANDLRRNFFVSGYFERFGATTNTWFTYVSHDFATTNGGMGVPEMFLTRAECKARNNDIAGAMADLEMVRVNRFTATNYNALPIPSTEKEAVDIIVDERRRENPFVLRFMDIKRLNNDPLTDPITITRTLNGETITVGPDDRRWARPIGQEIIDLSQGQTVQNQY